MTEKKKNKSNHNQIATQKIALRGLLVAVAMVLSWVEAQIPAFFAVPGIKLGLTNLVVLAALYCLSEKDAVLINLLRILLVGFTFGSMASMMYSLAGGLLSFVVMAISKRLDLFSQKGVSILGGVFHNIGQILMAMAVVENGKLIYYLPVLLISGVLAGIAIGIVASMITKRIQKAWKE